MWLGRRGEREAKMPLVSPVRMRVVSSVCFYWWKENKRSRYSHCSIPDNTSAEGGRISISEISFLMFSGSWLTVHALCTKPMGSNAIMSVVIKCVYIGDILGFIAE